MCAELEYLMTATCMSSGPMSRPSVTLIVKVLINSKPVFPMLADESRRRTRSIPLTRQAIEKGAINYDHPGLIKDQKHCCMPFINIALESNSFM